ncbi:MAG TPA: isoprenylcysteine carboxylmethyltransferase family protein, partial [Rhizomicrobium sp.]|nr:isoprenylcysteine carboxylmethyltransferase family protein [Rhizomicrobium sp.]
MKTTPAMAVAVIVSTLAWLALAAFAAGGIYVFLARRQFVALVAITFALAFATFFSEAGIRKGVREARDNRWVLAVFGALGLATGFLAPYTDRIGFWTLDGDVLRWFGVAIYAAGGVARMWPVFVLGRRFSGLVAIQEGHTLVTSGIYAHIRHPSYLGVVLVMAGWSLVFRSGVGLLLAALILVLLV